MSIAEHRPVEINGLDIYMTHFSVLAFFLDRVSVYRPDQPAVHYIDPIRLELVPILWYLSPESWDADMCHYIQWFPIYLCLKVLSKTAFRMCAKGCVMKKEKVNIESFL